MVVLFLAPTSGVYVIRNRLNGKQYIGSSIHIRKRIWKHQSELRTGKHPSPHLLHAYNKYGLEAFEFRALVYCEPWELLRYEQGMIDRLKPEYNTCPTAGNLLGAKLTEEHKEHIRQSHYGIRPSQETLEKLSKAHKGNIQSKETRRKRSEAQKGKPRPWMVEIRTGKKHSEETKRKISEALRGRTKSCSQS